MEDNFNQLTPVLTLFTKRNNISFSGALELPSGVKGLREREREVVERKRVKGE